MVLFNPCLPRIPSLRSPTQEGQLMPSPPRRVTGCLVAVLQSLQMTCRRRTASEPPYRTAPCVRLTNQPQRTSAVDPRGGVDSDKAGLGGVYSKSLLLLSTQHNNKPRFRIIAKTCSKCPIPIPPRLWNRETVTQRRKNWVMLLAMWGPLEK
jgi:hypothetical protein